MIFIIIYSYFTKNYLGLIALPFYLLIPLFISAKYVFSILFTTIGLLGMVWNWSPLLICIFTPAILANLGERIWWNSIQIVLVKELMKSQFLFDKLWQMGLLAIIDNQGNIIQVGSQER